MQLNTSRTTDKAADRVSRIKNAAAAQILAILPEWKQRNLLARHIELIEKRVDGQPLSAPEQTEIAQFKVLWAQIKSIRAKSDAAELSGKQPSEIIW